MVSSSETKPCHLRLCVRILTQGVWEQAIPLSESRILSARKLYSNKILSIFLLVKNFVLTTDTADKTARWLLSGRSDSDEGGGSYSSYSHGCYSDTDYVPT